MPRWETLDQYLRRQEQAIRSHGDYTGGVEPPKFDMDKPAPYPYVDFVRGGLARAKLEPTSPEEWRAWFEPHTSRTYRPMIVHTLRAHYATGVDYGQGSSCWARLSTVDGAIDAFVKRGLVCCVWNQTWGGRPFWGSMDSEAKAAARQQKSLVDANTDKYEEGVARRASLKAGEDPTLSHTASYSELKADRADKMARERGVRAPKKIERSKMQRKWSGPKKLELCPDCRQLCFLVDIEHRNGGERNGQLRSRNCPWDNKVARADYDKANHAYFTATGSDMTAADHDALVDLELAFAQPHTASDADLALLERVRRAAASATVPARDAILGQEYDAPPHKHRWSRSRGVACGCISGG